MSLETWLLYASAALVVILIPGPLSLLMISNSLNYGVRRSWPAFLGGVTASIALLSASALGLGALLMASERLFSALKLIGALYLFYLAWQSWQAARQAPAAREIESPALAPRFSRLFGRAFILGQQPEGHALLRRLPAAVSQRGATDAAAAAGDDPDLGRTGSLLQAGLWAGRAGRGALSAHRERACVVQPDQRGTVWMRGSGVLDESVTRLALAAPARDLTEGNTPAAVQPAVRPDKCAAHPYRPLRGPRHPTQVPQTALVTRFDSHQ